MRFAFIRAAALGCVCALASLAQQQLTVDKLLEFITSSISQKMPDKDVAGFLASVKLTEKLSPRTIEDLQGKGAGPKTVAALNPSCRGIGPTGGARSEGRRREAETADTAFL